MVGKSHDNVLWSQQNDGSLLIALIGERPVLLYGERSG